MRVLIEEYQYDASLIRDCLQGFDALENIDHMVSINYVGYFYSPKIQDCVFILPKVLLDETNKVFGHIPPEDMINIDSAKGLIDSERSFIYEFAVWIYRAISVYKDKNEKSDIVYYRLIAEMGSSKKFISNTFLDILLAMTRFNHENEDFFMYIVKNLHSGINKINWTRTIAKSDAIIQTDSAIYINPINKKRLVNFDEELIIIFFSILNYIKEEYGFSVKLNIQFPLIKGKKFEAYINKLGKARLIQIKYKYFSDKALRIWDLCYAFFDKAHRIKINVEQKEYLLVKNFNIVFESIIDELIGDKNIPPGLKSQYDGKRIDHMYEHQGLIQNKDKQTYYIGDSKYYKLGNKITKESVYKQYTYARNVIQWNLGLFIDDEKDNPDIQLRDEDTEGYNIIPNFFISAKMDEMLSYTDKIYKTSKKDKFFESKQFKNRLFDRDTLLIFHYDVNFLYVISLYARNNESQKSSWKKKVRSMFRTEIQTILKDKYDFYAMASKPGVIAKDYIRSNFKNVIGKVYTPFEDKDIYSLALDLDPKHADENRSMLLELSKYFYVEKCDMGQDPKTILDQAASNTKISIGDPSINGVLMVMMEQFDVKNKSFIDNGKIAIGVQCPNARMEIVKNLSSIGLILFHTRKKEGQHVYAVEGDVTIISSNERDKELYTNNSKAEIYFVVEFKSEGLVNIDIDSSKKSYTDKKYRYDAQYATLDELKQNQH